MCASIRIPINAITLIVIPKINILCSSNEFFYSLFFLAFLLQGRAPLSFQEDLAIKLCLITTNCIKPRIFCNEYTEQHILLIYKKLKSK